jgi:ribosomal protein S8
MTNTKIAWVYSQLQNRGYITRNECLSRGITRLASIINVMKKEGWLFETKKVDGDYKYIFIDNTKDRVELDLATNNYKLKYA